MTADFAGQLPRETRDEVLYAQRIAILQQRKGLRDITQDAAANVIERSARSAQVGEKISPNLGNLINLLQEADSRARKAGCPPSEKEHIEQTAEAQAHRVNQLQEQLQEEVFKGSIRIET